MLIGAGGVGDAIVKISADRNFFEKLIVSDYDIQRAEKSVDWVKALTGSCRQVPNCTD